ncbi:hypothetical protein BC829DRAFT_285513 [Chytridium lagenaria]|nr:hypothetical protein BC829DRAFT_285513 [Chytridium lagenaria]
MICKSRDMDKWLWVLLSPMMIVLVCGIYVSLQTRNVTSKYNEAGQISLSVCVVTLTMVILLILGNFIRE